MNRWIDYPQDERLTMIQYVADVKQIDEPAAAKDWNHETRDIGNYGKDYGKR